MIDVQYRRISVHYRAPIHFRVTTVSLSAFNIFWMRFFGTMIKSIKTNIAQPNVLAKIIVNVSSCVHDSPTCPKAFTFRTIYYLNDLYRFIVLKMVYCSALIENMVVSWWWWTVHGIKLCIYVNYKCIRIIPETSLF